MEKRLNGFYAVEFLHLWHIAWWDNTRQLWFFVNNETRTSDTLSNIVETPYELPPKELN